MFNSHLLLRLVHYQLVIKITDLPRSYAAHHKLFKASIRAVKTPMIDYFVTTLIR